MANLIPMAGEGSRFKDAGYALPKPLIKVSGKAMILKVIDDLPSSDKWIFVVRREHIERYHIDELIRSKIAHAQFVIVSETTQGQASTCLLAANLLEENEELLIAACDSGYLYDKTEFDRLRKDTAVDSILWTFTKRETLRKNPSAWGFAKVASDQSVQDMSIKQALSDDPYTDHAVVATFWYRHAKDFIQAAQQMIEQNYRINNEFYVDALPIFLNKMNKRTVIFDVDYYFGWGTPEDLKQYELLESVAQGIGRVNVLAEEDQNQFENVKRYFT